MNAYDVLQTCSMNDHQDYFWLVEVMWMVLAEKTIWTIIELY